MDEKNVHKDHRKRLRDQFLTYGIDPLTEVQALELLLFYSYTQKDTNPIAHELLETFGSLHGVLTASAEDLVRVRGVGSQSATLIRLVYEIARRAQIGQAESDKYLSTTSQCGAHMVPYFRNLPDEVVYLLSLDAKCKVLGCTKISTGNINSTSISIRNVVECALRTNATSVVLAHNHPSGSPTPSEEDIATTRLMQTALDMVDVLLADHIVVAGDRYVSMLERGLIEHRKR